MANIYCLLYWEKGGSIKLQRMVTYGPLRICGDSYAAIEEKGNSHKVDSKLWENNQAN
jgi:hypothetical protein